MRAALEAPQSIGDYALIGDTRTAALVGRDGSIDWLCFPRFDGEPVFGFLADAARGGRFSIGVEDARAERRYRGSSTVLETTFTAPDGKATLTDGMVADVSTTLMPQALLVRRIHCTAGRVRVRMLFAPRRGIPGKPMPSATRAGALVAEDGRIALALTTAPEISLIPERESLVELRAGQELTLALALADREPLVLASPRLAWQRLEATDRWWREWSRTIHYEGPNRGAVERSLLTLRLLTYAPSGAPVAAPTTSVPAPRGTPRTWDYRFSWPRDASIGVGTFLALCSKAEPRGFLRWLVIATRNSQPRIRSIYTLDGRPVPDERIVDGIAGPFEGPVRIGNGAGGQHQLDVYGWVVSAAAAMVDAGERLDRVQRRAVESFAGFAAARWNEPDHGIWEMRMEPQHYVHSKLMAWLALDHAVRIGESHGTRSRKIEAWRRQRDGIASEIPARGFSTTLNAYAQAYGRDVPDASILLPVTSFEDPASPRLHGTIDAALRNLAAGPGLFYRYPPGTDGLEGGDAAFVACSFWIVHALAYAGRRNEAEEIFDEACRRSNDVGLYAEEIDPATGHHEGNFPLALSHAALLQAACALSEASASHRASRRTQRARRA